MAVTVSTGKDVDEQLQGTLTVFAGPVKVKVALAGQTVSGIVTVT